MSGESYEPPDICKKLDRFVIKVGKAAAWSNCLLVLAIILNVVLRYVFGKGQVWLEELQWHLYGLAVMIGLSYSQAMDSPIRVDILHQRFSRRGKAFWEIVGSHAVPAALGGGAHLHGRRLSGASPGGSTRGRTRPWAFPSVGSSRR